MLVLVATLKGPRLAPGARLKIDLEDHGVTGVSGQQPHPIFRPERASPQGYQGLKRPAARLDLDPASGSARLSAQAPPSCTRTGG